MWDEFRMYLKGSRDFHLIELWSLLLTLSREQFPSLRPFSNVQTELAILKEQLKEYLGKGLINLVFHPGEYQYY